MVTLQSVAQTLRGFCQTASSPVQWLYHRVTDCTSLAKKHPLASIGITALALLAAARFMRSKSKPPPPSPQPDLAKPIQGLVLLHLRNWDRIKKKGLPAHVSIEKLKGDYQLSLRLLALLPSTELVEERHQLAVAIREYEAMAQAREQLREQARTQESLDIAGRNIALFLSAVDEFFENPGGLKEGALLKWRAALMKGHAELIEQLGKSGHAELAQQGKLAEAYEELRIWTSEPLS
jgi:hypothetical protein